MYPRIAFGSSISPCRTASDGKNNVLEERENSDPEKILLCPFDKSHQIRNCRLPYHLLKCKKNHPELAEELTACPFNARHLIHKQELANHVQICENRIEPKESKGKDEDHAWHFPVVARENPCNTEDWDMEADDHASPFVWGAQPQMNKEIIKSVNNLPPGFRAPNALPWASFKP